MNYDRATLRSTALAVKAEWERHYKDDHARKVAAHKKALAKWEAEQKPKTLVALQEATSRTKKGVPFDTYDLRSEIVSPPSAPGEVDCCTPLTKAIDTFVEVLDSISDDQVSSTALSMAGFKDLNKMMRRPC